MPRITNTSWAASSAITASCRPARKVAADGCCAGRTHRDPVGFTTHSVESSPVVKFSNAKPVMACPMLWIFGRSFLTMFRSCGTSHLRARFTMKWGHHLERTIGAPAPGGQAAAEAWKNRLLCSYLRKSYWYLVPFLGKAIVACLGHSDDSGRPRSHGQN